MCSRFERARTRLGAFFLRDFDLDIGDGLLHRQRQLRRAARPASLIATNVRHLPRPEQFMRRRLHAMLDTLPVQSHELREFQRHRRGLAFQAVNRSGAILNRPILTQFELGFTPGDGDVEPDDGVQELSV